MATLGEYGSLLQLGFGIGIGLSVFKAPTDLLLKRLANDLTAELAVFQRTNTDRANQVTASLSDLHIRLSEAIKKLESSYPVFLIPALAVAMINWVLLAIASTNAAYVLSAAQESLLIIVSGPVYIVIALIVWGWAQWLLLPIRGSLDTIRNG
jgi:hypothetical protein